MSINEKKKSGLRKLLETAKKESEARQPEAKVNNLFNEIAGIGWNEELTVDHEGALEEAEALAESSVALSRELDDMIPVLETASIARPISADLDKMENLLGEVERRVKIVRAALSRLETSGVVRANSKKRSF